VYLQIYCHPSAGYSTRFFWHIGVASQHFLWDSALFPQKVDDLFSRRQYKAKTAKLTTPTLFRQAKIF